jgi:DUSAM domain-containing protein
MSPETDWELIRTLARRVLEQGESLELTEDTRALLLRSAHDVALPQQDAEDALRSVTTATTLLQEIRRRIRDGSRRLTRAMNRASDLREAGDMAGARKLMEDLLAVEVVPLYREQAEIVLEETDRLEAVRTSGRIDPELNAWAQVRALAQRLQQGHALELSEDMRDFLRRAAPTVAFSEDETEAALESREGAETLLRRTLERIHDGKERILQALERMTLLRDAGDLAGARKQLEDVLAVEAVPLFRKMAEENLVGLDELPPSP